MEPRKVRLELAPKAAYSRIFVDDVDMTHSIRRVIVVAEVGGLSTVTLELINVEATITGHADVTLEHAGEKA